VVDVGLGGIVTSSKSNSKNTSDDRSHFNFPFFTPEQQADGFVICL
jgi:hypothetical protein